MQILLTAMFRYSERRYVVCYHLFPSEVDSVRELFLIFFPAVPLQIFLVTRAVKLNAVE